MNIIFSNKKKRLKARGFEISLSRFNSNICVIASKTLPPREKKNKNGRQDLRDVHGTAHPTTKKYLGIEIGSLLHQSANGKPETVGQREIVAAGQDWMLAVKQGIVIELMLLLLL
jgi:hypothetical protein